MEEPEGGWDRHRILMEVHRRGMTLTGIAKDAGLYASACRQGIGGQSRTGAEAIATALGIEFDVLFPNSYMRSRHHRADTNRNGSCNGSAKASDRTDIARGAA